MADCGLGRAALTGMWRIADCTLGALQCKYTRRATAFNDASTSLTHCRRPVSRTARCGRSGSTSRSSKSSRRRNA
eukprot:14965427-Alexandrium_andersonii.AAC.1